MKLSIVLALTSPTACSSFSIYKARHFPHTQLNVLSLKKSQPEQGHHGSTIDKELGSLGNDNDVNISNLHSILDDGAGHINSELARSIWNWENTHFQSTNNDPFPAKRLKYSTRDGLRMIDQIARSIDDGERYADLVQEGVVALMGCTVVWDDAHSDAPGAHVKIDSNLTFEDYARLKIEEAMSQAMKKSSDSGRDSERLGINIDILKRRGKEQSKRAMDAVSTATEPGEPSSLLVQNLSEAFNDANPTPAEIALSEMIRHDISEFLTRYLTDKELKIIRLRFGLNTASEAGCSPTGMTNAAIAKAMNMEEGDVIAIQTKALNKLRSNFEKDNIGAYIDDDFAEEVSL